MSVQAVGSINYQQPVQQKKSGVGRTLLATGVCATGGAMLGSAGMDLYMKSFVEEATLMTDPIFAENKFKDSIKKLGTFADDVIEQKWNIEKGGILKQANANLEKVLESVKKGKTRWAIIGAAIFGLMGLGLSRLAAKRSANIGTVEKVKDNQHIKQIVTTPSGQKIAVPILMGAQVSIRPMMNGQYEVTSKPSVPNAKTEVKRLTEQELLEQYKQWVV